MKIDVFCGWGEAGDVGINFRRTEAEARTWGTECTVWYVDLTVDEAREMAAQLLSSAERAEKLDREYAAYAAKENE